MVENLMDVFQLVLVEVENAEQVLRHVDRALLCCLRRLGVEYPLLMLAIRVGVEIWWTAAR